MIIKKIGYKTTRSFRTKIDYALTDKGRRDPLSSWAIFHNFQSIEQESLVREMEENSALLPPRKGRNLCYMDVLSFHPKDREKISQEALREVAQRYIQDRGLDRHFVLAVPHMEEEHLHVHVVYSANEIGAKRVPHWSNKQFANMKRGFERWQIERFPEWSHSVVQTKSKDQRSRQRPVDKEIQMKKRIGQHLTKKEKLWQQLSPLFVRSKTIDEFCKLIESNTPYKVYVYRGRPNGILVDGVKHRFVKLQLTAKILRQLEPLDQEQNRIQNRRKQLRKIFDVHQRKQKRRER